MEREGGGPRGEREEGMGEGKEGSGCGFREIWGRSVRSLD